jgi:hypothetical protein
VLAFLKVECYNDHIHFFSGGAFQSFSPCYGVPSRLFAIQREGGDPVKYSEEQIRQMADTHMKRLLNNEYKVAVLPNSANPYHPDKALRDSRALRDADTYSPLFRATFE